LSNEAFKNDFFSQLFHKFTIENDGCKSTK
jgi:hypothetical protein